MSGQPLSKFYFSFEGRVNRKDWWLKYALPLLIPAFIASVIVDEMTGYSDRSGPGVFVFLIILWPMLAISIKRWHDRDKAGWWMLIGVIPFIGGIWVLIENGFLPGTAGPNRFDVKTNET